MRDGQIVATQDSGASYAGSEESSADVDDQRYIAAPARNIEVGDRVRLRSFGSIGIVDSVKDGEAEVRVKALRFREKLENLELVQETTPAKREGGRFSKLRPTSNATVQVKEQMRRSMR
jgi:dsDNA-specific endonuclease/ATPase MutS2